MKSIFSILIILYSAVLVTQAQIGVSTDNPFGLFHIDPLSNTTKSGTTIINDTDDVVVTQDGRVGIGTAAPVSLVSLDIKGDIIISGNSPQADYVLHSDDLGNGFWKPVVYSLSMQNGQLSNSYPLYGGVFAYSNMYDITITPIILTKGKWLIYARMAITYVTRPSVVGYMQLINTTNPLDLKPFPIAGVTLPQMTPPYFVVPYMFGVVNVATDSPMKVEVFAKSVEGTPTTTASYGGSTFFALKLAD